MCGDPKAANCKQYLHDCAADIICIGDAEHTWHREFRTDGSSGEEDQ